MIHENTKSEKKCCYDKEKCCYDPVIDVHASRNDHGGHCTKPICPSGWELKGNYMEVNASSKEKCCQKKVCSGYSPKTGKYAGMGKHCDYWNKEKVPWCFVDEDLAKDLFAKRIDGKLVSPCVKDDCSVDPEKKFSAMEEESFIHGNAEERSNDSRLTQGEFHTSASFQDGLQALLSWRSEAQQAWEDVGRGKPRKCLAADGKGSHANFVLRGVASVDRCKAACIAARSCRGIDFHGTWMTRCELWMTDIGGSTKKRGHACWKVI
eukprot:TRINITY_DN1067_c0_g1_i16.p1 TRINITY_DN1067_c0_g1~~TRINITY_DN1067_c0_g1_i16.p1  ORF type:complete len:265 (-),score=57.84 TRINITY_DN1067_c0_g1_i16:145-939(-)